MRTDHLHAMNDRLDAWLAETDEAIEIATHELTRLQRLRDQLGRARAEATAETGAAPIDLPAMLRRNDRTLQDHAAGMAREKTDWMAAATRRIEETLGLPEAVPVPQPLPDVVDEFPEHHDNRFPARS